MRRGVCLSTIALALVCYTGVQAVAAAPAGASAAALKAAFLYNFVKLAEWPATAIAADGSVIVCTDDGAVADSLLQLLKNRDSHDRAIDVRRVNVDSAQLRNCHVLYLTDLNTARFTQLVDAVDGAAVLTVGDLDRFAALGGIVQFVQDGGHLRFAINLDSMRRHRLQLSSRLLALASIVKDETIR